MSTAAKRLVTAEELLHLPDDGLRRELVYGEVIEMTPAGFPHGAVAARLVLRLAGFVEERGLGAVLTADPGFVLRRDPDVVRAPDAAFVSKERLPAEPIEGFFPGAPDLAVEVVSPSETSAEIEAKVAEYLAAGARLVWVVYPTLDKVRVWRSPTDTTVLGLDDPLDGEDVLPGFTCPLREVLAPAP